MCLTLIYHAIQKNITIYTYTDTLRHTEPKNALIGQARLYDSLHHKFLYNLCT